MPKLKQRGTRYFKTTAFRRGIMGTSRGWFVVWIGLAASGYLRRKFGRTEDVVYRTELQLGETLVVEHNPPKTVTRKRRKATS